ncbi:multidrug oligosaccharidyl-lipid polysaccharide flippase [Moniliophthora roreri MCA 2997]|uniref:Multidrug oligosaccharidyl-lipid polysaccharide flippase n=1 Tax=Moniliophthora roreri (strain MCA 2997) TaxID=1381753 RepID=V2X721_MONRO|nr:multidrug oligosaccharidyl-lipid polysaccharide flippase [Moniliophthora roreri MCA 2997]
MTSTANHYQGSGSLPSDYALLSRYAARQDSMSYGSNSDSSHGNRLYSERSTLRVPSSTAGMGRTSLPARRRPSKDDEQTERTTITPRSNPSNENTPLLNPPRIVEDVEQNDGTDRESSMQMFRDELGILTKYALPVFGTHLLEYTLVIASVLTIGHLSTNALAAITLGSMTANVTGLTIIQGFTSALDTVLPSAWTSSQPHLVGLWAQRMTVVIGFILVPMLFIWFNAEAILLSLKQEPEIAHLASVYLRWMSLGLPAYAFNLISRFVHHIILCLFTIPTRIIFVVAPINALLNYLLVWGPEPIRLGFIGAPIATAISFNLISLMTIIYGVFFAPKTAWCPISRRSFTSLGTLVHLGLGGVGQTATEWWAWELVGLAASLIGPVALASQSVLLVSASTTFQAPYALGVATSVRVGNLLGEQRARRAGIVCKTAIFIAFVVALVFSLMFFIFRQNWSYMFNEDPEVAVMVSSTLPLVALFQVFDGNSAVVSGILRARGKQVTGALLAISAYYIIGVPFGVWLAFNFNLGLHGLWIGLTISLTYCSIFGSMLCLRTDWDREAAKVAERIANEHCYKSDAGQNGSGHL